MPISDTEKVDFLLKKVGYELAKTAASSSKSSDNESIASPITISSQNLWLDTIPTNSASASSSVQPFFIKLDPDLTAPTNRTWLTNIGGDWISKAYGNYGVRVWVAQNSPAATAVGNLVSSTELQPAGTSNDGFFVDYAAGVIHFADTSVPSALGVVNRAIYISGFRYVGAKGSTDTARKSLDLTQFASTSASNLKNKISETTGSGALVFQSGSLLDSLGVTNGIRVSGDSTFYDNVNISGTLSVKGGSVSFDQATINAVSLSATSGSFTDSLTLGGTGVSLQGHTHVSSNITDLTEAVQDIIGSGDKSTTGFLRNGGGLAWTYTDGSGTLGAAITGVDLSLINGLDGYIANNLNTSIIQSTGIELVYNSTQKTLAIAVTGIPSSLVTNFNTSTNNLINTAISGNILEGSGINLDYNSSTNQLTITSNITGVSGVEVTHDPTNNQYTISLNDPSISLSDITDLSGLAKTFLEDSSSSNLANLITDETGSGKLVFADSPVLSGVSISGNLTVGGNLSLSGSGLQTSNIDNFDTAVKAYKLNQLAAPDGDVGFNSKKITNLATPTADNDAATKAYVDAARSGLDVKQSVRVATAFSFTTMLQPYSRNGNVLTRTSNGILGALDDVTLAVNDRILIKNETGGLAANNGIYVVTSLGSMGTPWILTRAADADSDAEVTAGMFTFVTEGTTNADSGWVLTTNDAITLNVTSLMFAQFSGAGQITAGSGLVKSGNEINIATASSSRIVVNADDIDLAKINGDNGVPTTVSSTSVLTFVSAVSTDIYGRVTGLTTAPVSSSITVGSTTLTLNGSAVTTISGLTALGATTISGALVGNADTATRATNATNIEVDTNTTTATNYLVFVSGTDGDLKPSVNSYLRFDASTTGLIGSDNTTPKTKLEYFIIDGGTP